MPVIRRAVSAASVVLLASACATRTPAPEVSISVPPPNAGVYKIGNPYEILGTWYYPREQPDYDETGVASWYGPTFYGKRTADGEPYDAEALTAAHRTLPMPVNVRVTNLDNGKSLIVRINDRGPFSKGRIIDVSERAARLLGFINEGTARVRVTYVSKGLQPNGEPQPPETPVQVASALPAAPTTAVDVGALGGVPGAATAPPPPPVQQQPPEQTAAVPPTSIDQLVTSQPTGQVTTVPVPKSTALYVQVGAFSIYRDAVRIRDRLGTNLVISTIERRHQKLYRVRSGPYERVADADSALADLIARGSPDAEIVVAW